MEEARIEVIKKFYLNDSGDYVPISKLFTKIGNSKYLALFENYSGLNFSALTTKASTFAQVEWELYKRGKEVKDNTDLIYSLLKQPNPYFTDFEFRFLYAVYKFGLGEVFIYVYKDKFGVPQQLWILPTPFVHIVWETDKQKRKKGQIIRYYELTNTTAGGEPVRFSPDEIIFIRTPDPRNIYRGFGELEASLLEYDIHNLSKKYIRDFYQYGAVPKGILVTDQRLKPEEIDRLRKDWISKYGGKWYEIPILTGGLRFEIISTDPTTSAYIDQAKWTRDDILSIFKVPLSKLGYSEGVNRAVAREQNYMFSRDVILPEIIRYSEFINVQLFGMTELLKDYKFKFKSVIPKDEELMVEKARVGATFGAITVNELRQFLGLKPIKGGDVLVQPLNAGGRPKGTKKPTSENQQEGEPNSAENNKSFKEIFKQIENIIIDYEEM